MATNYGALQFWLGHYEKEFPRRENYKKKTLTHLEKLEKKLTHYLDLCREGLTQHPDDKTMAEMRTIYEYHHRAALLAIAAKTGKMKAA